MSAFRLESVRKHHDSPRNWPANTMDLEAGEPVCEADEVTVDLQHDDAVHIVDAGRLERMQLKSEQTPAVPTPIGPGAILSDRYIIERMLGQGGTAVVYRARDIRWIEGGRARAQIAIKTPLPDSPDLGRASNRLKHEFRIAQMLAHPNIVRVFDLYCPHDAPCFMSMELIEGKLLSEMLTQQQTPPISLANRILLTCAEALAHAHSREVVHGDFKPDNIFVTPDGSVKIFDFGAAAASPEHESRIPAATAAYASPEVLSGETPEPRDDVFSFGCVAYELLTGRHPFGGQSSLQAREAAMTPQRAWNLSAPQWLALLSSLSWHRAQRPDSIAALVSKLTADFADVIVTEAAPGEEPAVVPRPTSSLESPQANRSWGFFAFAIAACSVIFFSVERSPAPPSMVSDEPVPRVSTPLPVMGSPVPTARPASAELTESDAAITLPGAEPTSAIATTASELDTDTAPTRTAPAPTTAPARPRPPAGTAQFTSDAIVTSETSIAAVFVVERSAPLTGRASVQWTAEPGTAQPDEDYLATAGSVEFLDGQSTRAIYIPLRNDELAEPDETFTIRLHSPHGMRLGGKSTATATIRDDD